jgi:hypothetical protein
MISIQKLPIGQRTFFVDRFTVSREIARVGAPGIDYQTALGDHVTDLIQTPNGEVSQVCINLCVPLDDPQNPGDQYLLIVTDVLLQHLPGETHILVKNAGK